LPRSTSLTAQAFGTYEEIRRRLYVALTTGQAPPISSEELIERSNAALDLLMEVSSTAMRAAELQAISKEADAIRSLFLHTSLLVLGFLVGLAGFWVVQTSGHWPIRAITQTMGRLATGELAMKSPVWRAKTK